MRGESIPVGVHERAVRQASLHLRRKEGQAVVEFALVAPLLLLLVFGIIKFGIVYNNYIQLTNAVGVGAREFAVERGQADPCSDVYVTFTNAATTAIAAKATLTMSEPTPSNPYVIPPSGPTGTCPWSPAGTVGGLTSADPAKLTASIPCDLTILGIDFFPSCTLQASATESVQ